MGKYEDRNLKRISLLIGEDQYETVTKEGLNLSLLVRDLLDQHIEGKHVIIHVGEETLKLYNKVIGLQDSEVSDFEPYFKNALHAYLKEKIAELQKLDKKLQQK